MSGGIESRILPLVIAALAGVDRLGRWLRHGFTDRRVIRGGAFLACAGGLAVLERVYGPATVGLGIGTLLVSVLVLEFHTRW